MSPSCTHARQLSTDQLVSGVSMTQSRSLHAYGGLGLGGDSIEKHDWMTGSRSNCDRLGRV